MEQRLVGHLNTRPLLRFCRENNKHTSARVRHSEELLVLILLAHQQQQQKQQNEMMTAIARPNNLLKSLEQGSGVQNYTEHTKNIISFRISKLRISLKFLSFLHMSILLRLICERSISSFKMNKVLIWKHIKITKNVQFWDTIRISYPSNLFFYYI